MKTFRHDADGLMAETLAVGVRRADLEHFPVATVDQVFSQPDDHRPDTWLGIGWTEHLPHALANHSLLVPKSRHENLQRYHYLFMEAISGLPNRAPQG